MYVTRRLSLFQRSPNSLSAPPEGPNSGYLVIQDEESETEITTCCGTFKSRQVRDLPIPQNKELGLEYGSDDDDVAFVPVLNEPLSSNRYYAIKPHQPHKGVGYACSKEEDARICCFCCTVRHVDPRPLDPSDIYQQFEIVPYKRNVGSFFAKSVAPDGYPPYFLSRKGWGIVTRTPKHYQLNEALGVNTATRILLPESNFPLLCKTSQAIVVGKWYCPFMFVKDGAPKDQIKTSMFYEMTLEQRWEQIFACENEYNVGKAVSFNVVVRTEMAFVGGRIQAMWDERKVGGDGVIWFKGSGDGDGRVGLHRAIVERMKWEEERGGWIGGEEREVIVNRTMEFEGAGNWGKFGCYVLVETFVLKRMDGSAALTYDFKHTNLIRCKWE